MLHERGNNRFYDGLNTYGDFQITTGLVADLAGQPYDRSGRTSYPDDINGLFTPNGYREVDFVDNTTESIKVGGALHYRINDNLDLWTVQLWFGKYSIYSQRQIRIR